MSATMIDTGNTYKDFRKFQTVKVLSDDRPFYYIRVIEVLSDNDSDAPLTKNHGCGWLLADNGCCYRPQHCVVK